MRWVIDAFRWILDTVLRPQGAEGFVLLPKRWVVERTYGWLHGIVALMWIMSTYRHLLKF